jgi:hypothetical protein
VTLRVTFRFDGLTIVNVAQPFERTTMLQDRLMISFAVLHVHRDIDIDIDMRSFTLGKSRHIDVGYRH